ncbi:TPA: hypothetical protein ACHVEU_001167 [Streptococcus suis]
MTDKREKRETRLHFQEASNSWICETNVPRHIKEMLKDPLYEVLEQEQDGEKITWLKASLRSEYGADFFPEINPRIRFGKPKKIDQKTEI